VTDDAIPVRWGVPQRGASPAACKVGAEETADRRIIDHHAAAEIGSVTRAAAVARLDQMPASLDGLLSADEREVRRMNGVDS
jgi:hypothetical protein